MKTQFLRAFALLLLAYLVLLSVLALTWQGA